MGSMPAIFVRRHLLTMMGETQLFCSKFLVVALSSACKTLCWLKVMGTGSLDGLLGMVVSFTVPCISDACLITRSLCSESIK